MRSLMIACLERVPDPSTMLRVDLSLSKAETPRGLAHRSLGEGGRTSDWGFSLIELVIAMAAFAVAVVPILYVASAGQRLARSQPEAGDLQQRLRVVADKLQRDLAMAGAGPLHGSLGARFGQLVPAVVPARTGLRSPDAPLTTFDDRLTILSVPDAVAAVPLAAPMLNPAAHLTIDPATSGCPSSGLCGFLEGTRALIVDAGHPGDGYELFTTTGIAANALQHGSPNALFTRAYSAGAVVVPIAQRVYHFDRPGRRLMLYDGYQSDMPLIDNVVDVRFELFAGAMGTSVRAIPHARLADGPALGIGPNVFDRDLLDIRMVRVTLRLEAAADDVRGVGVQFRRPGRSNSAFSYVPDHEVTFEVTLRNLGGTS